MLIGTAGGLVVDQRPGEVVVPTLAVRADGTSDHYASADEPAAPDAGLHAKFCTLLDSRDIAWTDGPCWTTAAPFRTTADEIAYYARRRVLAVEEEAAALFVVGSARNVGTVAALVLDGVPTEDDSWHVDLGAAQQRLQQLFAVSIEFAASL